MCVCQLMRLGSNTQGGACSPEKRLLPLRFFISYKISSKFQSLLENGSWARML